MSKLVMTNEDVDRFYETAARATAMCNKGKACPTPIYCGCPFKHVSKMPQDCKKTTIKQWIVLLRCLENLEGTI